MLSLTSDQSHRATLLQISGFYKFDHFDFTCDARFRIFAVATLGNFNLKRFRNYVLEETFKQIEEKNKVKRNNSKTERSNRTDESSEDCPFLIEDT